MVSQGNETCRPVPQTPFRLVGPTQTALPSRQTPQTPVSSEGASRDEKAHVRSSTVLITMNATTTSPASPSKQGLSGEEEEGDRHEQHDSWGGEAQLGT